MEKAKGEILAFLDDDAFPSPDWLKNAAPHFQNEEVAAVGGPAVTPQSDNVKQKASGFVYSSFLGGGNHRYRYFPTSLREVDDYPTCNLLVRKSTLEELGGFGSLFWPGEDTVLCLNITQKLGKKIIYDPGVLVYHHRRPLFLPHLKQIKNYALHRGYFVKHFPETSLKLSYLLPSLWVSALVGGLVISLFHSFMTVFFLSMVLVYLGLVFLSGIRPKDLRLSLLVFPGIILTHLTYGTFFIQGLVVRKLKNGRAD
jgi:GT2 family glycosyltransferase